MRRPTPLAGAVLALALALAPTAAAQTTPTDQYFGLEWGQQQLHTPQAWDTSTGVGQTVAIVDSGVDLDHPDLAGKIAGGTTFTGCAAQPAGGGNGDWKSAPGAGPPSPHGTHVAGITAATTNTASASPAPLPTRSCSPSRSSPRTAAPSRESPPASAGRPTTAST